MSEQEERPAQPPVMGKTLRTIMTVLMTVFSCSIISLVTWWGEPGNSLHESALAWAFAMQMGILVGVGFSAITSIVPLLMKGKL